MAGKPRRRAILLELESPAIAARSTVRTHQRLITIDLENRARDLRASGRAYDDATEVDYLAWWLVTESRTLEALAADLGRVNQTPIRADAIERWLRRAYVTRTGLAGLGTQRRAIRKGTASISDA